MSLAKNIGKKLNGKDSQKRLDHTKTSAPDILKYTSKRLNQKYQK